MRTLALHLLPWAALMICTGCDPEYDCGDDLRYNESTGLCDCLTGGTFDETSNYCRYPDGAVSLRDGAILMPARDGGTADACANRTFYRDADGDDHGSMIDTVVACEAPAGYVESGEDCDDACAACLPGGTEVCTDPPRDENCDGSSNEDCACTDGTNPSCGTTDTGECALGTQECIDGELTTCEGAIEPVEEVCNDLDDDCDGTVDEGLDRMTFHTDCDGDSYAPLDASTRIACSVPPRSSACGAGATSGWTTNTPVSGSFDCLDTNHQVHSGQTEWFTWPVPGTTSYDYDCDGIATPGITNVNWRRDNCGPALGEGWVGSEVPSCGVEANLLVCNSLGLHQTYALRQACH